MKLFNKLIFSFFLIIGSFSSTLFAVSEEQPPSVIVVFGATGDLTAKKILPAIYNLSKEGYLSPNTVVVGAARRENSDEDFRNKMHEALEKFSRTKPDEESWNSFKKKLFYVPVDFAEDEGYDKLHELLERIDQQFETKGNRLYYLATQPSYFSKIVEKLHAHELLYKPNEEKWSKVIIEKPFGRDLESSIQLQEKISQYLDESQIYRIDHFLGKKGLQNLLTFRFENCLFEPLWNKDFIDHVQITLSENIGIESRAQFWEETGLLRDILQNHILQLLAAATMERPKSFQEEDIHLEKSKLFNAIRPIPLQEIDQYFVRGQYGPKSSTLGYRQEKDVPKESNVETFVAAKFFIDNERWKDVPFYIRSGKRLPTKTVEIVISFKHANALFIQIQPDIGIFFKIAPQELDHNPETVVFGYQMGSFFKKSFPEAYEKLILDSLAGDRTYFVKADEHFAAWRLLTPVLDHWKKNPPKDFPNYDAGSWGPKAADELITKDGRNWLLLETKQ